MAHAHCMIHTYGYKQTLRIFNTYCFPTAKKKWLHERASLLRCMYIASTVEYQLVTMEKILVNIGNVT